MKYLFLLAALAVFGFASAQDDDLHYFQKRLNKQNKSFILPEYQPGVSVPPQQNQASTQKEQTYVSPDGNNVTILTEDNMPCIKPDLSQFNMPVAGSPEMPYPQIAAIPNPGLKGKPYSDRLQLMLEKNKQKKW